MKRLLQWFDSLFEKDDTFYCQKEINNGKKCSAQCEDCQSFMPKQEQSTGKIVNDKILAENLFKEYMKDNVIPRIEEMRNKELAYFQLLVLNNTNSLFLETSQKYLAYYENQLKEYKKYISI